MNRYVAISFCALTAFGCTTTVADPASPAPAPPTSKGDEANAVCGANGDCDRGSYCHFEIAAECGRTLSGQCQPIISHCIELYDPVCGCDGETYSNECRANAAGVSALYQGECEGNGPVCGANEDCKPGSYCHFEIEAECGRTLSGQCQPIFTHCVEIYDPICGCDGETYNSECKANTAGISVLSRGECGPAPAACTNNGDCGENDFCNIDTHCGFRFDEREGYVPVAGRCEPRPEACVELYEPACGCNGVTYDNACKAHRSGVSVSGTGYRCDEVQ